MSAVPVGAPGWGYSPATLARKAVRASPEEPVIRKLLPPDDEWITSEEAAKRLNYTLASFHTTMAIVPKGIRRKTRSILGKKSTRGAGGLYCAADIDLALRIWREVPMRMRTAVQMVQAMRDGRI